MGLSRVYKPVLLFLSIWYGRTLSGYVKYYYTASGHISGLGIKIGSPIARFNYCGHFFGLRVPFTAIRRFTGA